MMSIQEVYFYILNISGPGNLGFTVQGPNADSELFFESEDEENEIARIAR